MEAEVVTIRDDVTESRASQIGVLWRRINDVLGLRVDAVSEVSRYVLSTSFAISGRCAA